MDHFPSTATLSSSAATTSRCSSYSHHQATASPRDAGTSGEQRKSMPCVRDGRTHNVNRLKLPLVARGINPPPPPPAIHRHPNSSNSKNELFFLRQLAHQAEHMHMFRAKPLNGDECWFGPTRGDHPPLRCGHKRESSRCTWQTRANFALLFSPSLDGALGRQFQRPETTLGLSVRNVYRNGLHSSHPEWAP